MMFDPSESPPPSAQPLPPRLSASPAKLPSQSQGFPRPDRPAEPTRQHFDPWNSSSTGHQRAENRLSGSTSWRQSRNAKLAAQFGGGPGGGARVADTVGAGSENFGKNGRRASGGWERGASGPRDKRQLAIWESMGRTAKKRNIDGSVAGQVICGKGLDETSFAGDGRTAKAAVPTGESAGGCHRGPENTTNVVASGHVLAAPRKQVFRGLCFYINGSTAPTISDHKLKILLASHGASTSIVLGRQSVTHVIIGRSGQGGAGGGLASGKLQQEITRVGVKGVKYVDVEWVVESVRSGKRLPEARFSNLKVAPAGQGSVYSIFRSRDGTNAGKA